MTPARVAELIAGWQGANCDGDTALDWYLVRDTIAALERLKAIESDVRHLAEANNDREDVGYNDTRVGYDSAIDDVLAVIRGKP